LFKRILPLTSPRRSRHATAPQAEPSPLARHMRSLSLEKRGAGIGFLLGDEESEESRSLLGDDSDTEEPGNSDPESEESERRTKSVEDDWKYQFALHCTALHCTALHCTALHTFWWNHLTSTVPDPQDGRRSAVLTPGTLLHMGQISEALCVPNLV
jgi:hypothetical protein